MTADEYRALPPAERKRIGPQASRLFQEAHQYGVPLELVLDEHKIDGERRELFLGYQAAHLEAMAAEAGKPRREPKDKRRTVLEGGSGAVKRRVIRDPRGL